MAAEEEIAQTQSAEPQPNTQVNKGTEAPAAEKPEAPKTQEPLIKEFPMKEKTSTLKTIIIVLVIILAGIGSGYFLSSRGGSGKPLKSSESTSEEEIQVGDVFGVPDKDAFRDEVEGIIIKGGIDGEGSHHLQRPGGESQNVYLTSSVVDLDQFVGHKVKILGETFSAQQAGWLMDVGRVEIIELNAEKFTEE